MARPVNRRWGRERKWEHADTWQRRFATLIFADLSRMSVVRRRLPPTRHVARTVVRHIAETGIPPQDSPACSQVRSLKTHRRSARGPSAHEAPHEASELA